MLKIVLIFYCLFLFKDISFAQFKQNHTLFFVRYKNGSLYHRIFVDTNKKSKFYDYVADFKIKDFDTDSYERTLTYLKSNKLFPKRVDFKGLAKEWVKIETYKGIIYVYSPADYYFHYKVKLTDSVFINWAGEGPEANFIEKYRQINADTYQFILQSESSSHREITIKYIDIKIELHSLDSNIIGVSQRMHKNPTR